MPRSRLTLLISASVIAALASGIGLYAHATANAASTTDRVHITVTQRQYDQPRHQAPVFDRTFTDAAAQTVLDDLRSYPVLPPNAVQHCPVVSNSVPFSHYDIVFTERHAVVLTITSDAIGCSDLIATDAHGSRTVYFWYHDGHSFWADLHRLTGAPVPDGLA